VLDWKNVVREKLGATPLDAEKREEIIEELAQQLEAAYQDELAKGADKFDAVRRSLAQFGEWEKLRADIFQSVNGRQLPVWEQSGIFAPRRPFVWVTLAVAAGLLLLPSFRKALHMLSFLGQPSAWDQRAFSESALQKLQRSGDRQKYANALAYVALHSPDPDRAAAAAKQAIDLDAQLTWISAHVARACCGAPVPDASAWIERLKAWDPENAYPHLLDAQVRIHAETRASEVSHLRAELREGPAADPHWRGEMERAFAASRMDSYVARQFVLDRSVLLDQGLDYPDTLLLASASVDLPDLLMLKMYADHLVRDIAPSEESAGRAQNALAMYRNVALFGQKMADGDTTIEQMFSAILRKEALQSTIALLRRQGRATQAADAELALAATVNEEKKSRLEFTSEPIAYRSGQLILISAVLALLLAILVAAWLLCLAILRRWPNFRRLDGVASRLGWAPFALSISCAALFVSFVPYAKSIRDYSTSREMIAAFNGIYEGFYGLQPEHIPLLDGGWIDHLFWPVIWCLAIVLLGIVVLSWISSRRPPARLTE
jgi:hypothetical protein